MNSHARWRAQRQRVLLGLLLFFPIISLLAPAAQAAGGWEFGPGRKPFPTPDPWTKEIEIEVFVEKFAAVSVSPDRTWQLRFEGQGRTEPAGNSTWRFVAEPPEEHPLAFTVHANTNVHVTLSGGGGLRASEETAPVHPIYYFVARNRKGAPTEYRYPSGPETGGSAHGQGHGNEHGRPFPAPIPGPTGEAGVTFQLHRAEIFAASLGDVEAGSLGTTQLTVTVAADGSD